MQRRADAADAALVASEARRRGLEARVADLGQRLDEAVAGCRACEVACVGLRGRGEALAAQLAGAQEEGARRADTIVSLEARVAVEAARCADLEARAAGLETALNAERGARAAAEQAVAAAEAARAALAQRRDDEAAAATAALAAAEAAGQEVTRRLAAAEEALSQQRVEFAEVSQR